MAWPRDSHIDPALVTGLEPVRPTEPGSHHLSEGPGMAPIRSDKASGLSGAGHLLQHLGPGPRRNRQPQQSDPEGERLMTENEIDLMNADHTIELRRAYLDLDGIDWRHDPPDDRAVADALRPDRPHPRATADQGTVTHDDVIQHDDPESG